MLSQSSFFFTKEGLWNIISWGQLSTNTSVYCDYFLANQFKRVFWVLKRTFSKKNNFCDSLFSGGLHIIASNGFVIHGFKLFSTTNVSIKLASSMGVRSRISKDLFVTFDFQGGRVQTPYPPSGSANDVIIFAEAYLTFSNVQNQINIIWHRTRCLI